MIQVLYEHPKVPLTDHLSHLALVFTSCSHIQNRSDIKEGQVGGTNDEPVYSEGEVANVLNFNLLLAFASH